MQTALSPSMKALVAVSSPKLASRLDKDEVHFEETTKTNSKRKRTPGKEKASDAIEYDSNLIGKKVKVWWPDDDMFYEGVIDGFDPVKKKHKVSYTDGDEEILNLRNERWELVSGNSESDGEQATECQCPDPSSDMHKKKKVKTNPEPSAKQGKREGSRGGEASSSKSKATLVKDLTKSSTEDDDKEAVSSPKLASRLDKDEVHLEETTKTNSKKKRTPGKEKASDAIEYDSNLIGKRVKVWWPDEDMFYEGVIDGFDPIKKKHKVSYKDGDEEILNLRNERWELVSGNSESDGEQATECQCPDPSSDMLGTRALVDTSFAKNERGAFGRDVIEKRL